MPNNFLVPEIQVGENGTGPVLELGSAAGGTLLLTLGIAKIVEQESLDVAILGSTDGADWPAKLLAAFPQKFYAGAYSILLDLSAHPEIRYLRAKWQVARWGVGSTKPMFTFYVFAEPVSAAKTA